MTTYSFCEHGKCKDHEPELIKTGYIEKEYDQSLFLKRPLYDGKCCNKKLEVYDEYTEYTCSKCKSIILRYSGRYTECECCGKRYITY